VIGEPFVIGIDQVTTTASLELAVATVAGDSGLNAASRVTTSE
jgi:hypothetical protein